MPFATRAFITSAMLAMASAQGVIVKAVGDSGNSYGLQVDSSDSTDANFISLAEISANVVNECGRTLAKGNIDIGENTEDALASGDVTKVTQGSKVKVTINQVNSNGTGPYTCDLDQTSNASGTSGQVALDVEQDDSSSNKGQLQLQVSLPDDMACIGSSQGNVCTVRCRNAQDYGGCFAVQQTDTSGLPDNNSPSNITTAQTLEGIMAQVQQNQKDLPAAIDGNQDAKSVDDQGIDIVESILDDDSSISQQVEKELATASVSASTAAATSDTTSSGSSTTASGSGTGSNTNSGHKNHNGHKGHKGNNKRMSPAARRASRYVVAGKNYEEEGN
ncbi:hypothetical protein SLS53_008195 [Cytospora paraplurivora]|uniref:GEgh 16 protein n=1 Tax=Cytospora paraplurivora TaxID=2898453 RepID=A0AAN9TZG4_9PEZI